MLQYIDYNLSKQSVIDGHLACFKIFINTKSATEIILVYFFTLPNSCFFRAFSTCLKVSDGWDFHPP